MTYQKYLAYCQINNLVPCRLSSLIDFKKYIGQK